MNTIRTTASNNAIVAIDLGKYKHFQQHGASALRLTHPTAQLSAIPRCEPS